MLVEPHDLDALLGSGPRRELVHHPVDPGPGEPQVVDRTDRPAFEVGGDRLDADRAAIIVVDDYGEISTVHLVQPGFVHVEPDERLASGLAVELPVGKNLREVSRSTEKPVRDARRAAGAAGDPRGVEGLPERGGRGRDPGRSWC